MGDFAKQTDAKFEDGYIRFFLGETDTRREYEISADALLQAFDATDASGPGLLEAFERGRERILEVAQATASTPATDGVIELGSGDFEPRNDRGGMSPGED